MYHPEETMHRADLFHAGGPRRICIVSNDIPRITKGQAGQHEGSSANDLVAEMCDSRSFPRSATRLIYDDRLFRINGQAAWFAIPFPWEEIIFARSLGICLPWIARTIFDRLNLSSSATRWKTIVEVEARLFPRGKQNFNLSSPSCSC